MNDDLKAIINGSNNALRELNNAVSYAEDAKRDLNSTLNNLENAYGGQGAKNMKNDVQGFSRTFSDLERGLLNVENMINAEKNDCQQNMK